MAIISEFWAASASIRAQDTGPGIFDIVDGQAGSDVAGFYRGFTTSFRLKAGKSTWFHVPLPTPTVIWGKRLSLSTVTLLWDCEDGACFTWATIHLGGATRIELTSRATAISGEIDTALEYPNGMKVTTRRTDLPLAEPLPVTMGLQLCLNGEAPEKAGTLRFYGAGATFIESLP